MNLADQLHQLYEKFGALPGISIELHKQLIAVAVETKAASATIFLQGAQVAEYQQKGKAPLLWLSDTCDYQAGTPLRGGIPICWPWFGDLDKNPESVTEQYQDVDSMPAHGFVRSCEWSLDDISIEDEHTTRVTLSLALSPSDEWPFACRLELIIMVSEALKLSFSVTNLDERAFTFTSAMHTYFNVGQIGKAQVTGLEGVEYVDTLNDWVLSKDENAVRVNSETDRIYQNVGDKVCINDNDHQRVITLKAENAKDVIFWNPWIEKSKRLSHFPDDGYLSMLCLESANVLDNAVTLERGECFTSIIQIN